MAERPTSTFGANTEMNLKEECKVIFTRRASAEKEKRIEADVHDEEGEKKKKEKKIRVRRVVMRSNSLRPRPKEKYHQPHQRRHRTLWCH